MKEKVHWNAKHATVDSVFALYLSLEETLVLVVKLWNNYQVKVNIKYQDKS